MNVTQIGGGSAFQGPWNDLPQPLRRKRIIRQAGQGEPLETNLTAIPLSSFPDGRKICTLTMEDGLYLMKVTVNPMHAMVLADILPDIEQSLRSNPQPQLLQDFAHDRGLQGLAVILSTPRKD